MNDSSGEDDQQELLVPEADPRDPGDADVAPRAEKADAANPDSAPEASPAGDGAMETQSDRPLHILTNRSNLAYWLSSGVIGPLEQFSDEKYWDDLLGLVHGRLPVFSGPLGSAVDAVPPAAPGQFPVALELPAQAVQPLTPVDEAVGQESSVWLTSAWIPTSEVTRVVFRSEDEREEYEARDYPNLPSADPAVVDAELLTMRGLLTASEIRTLLAEADGAQVPPELETAVERLRLADRCSGAVCMGLAALPADLAFGRRLKWSAAVACDLRGLGSGLRSLLGRAAISEPGVLAACLTAVSRLRRSRGWDPQSVLDGVKEDVHAMLTPKTQERIAAQLDYMDRVLGMEARLDVTDARLGDAALTALLVFLLHPAPDDALSWTESVGVGSPVRILSAAYAGLAEGLTRLHRDFKPRALVATLVTWYLDALGLPGKRAAVPAKLTARFVPTRDLGGRLEVLSGAEVAASHERPSVTDALLARDLSDRKLADTLVDLCVAMSWERECVVHELEISSTDPVQIRSVDRVTFVGRLVDALEARLLGAGGKLLVRYRGDAATRSYVDEPAFRARLEAEGLTAAVAKQFEARLS